MTLDEDLTTRIERQRRLLLIMLQDTDNVEIALGDLSITNRLYRNIEPYCPCCRFVLIGTLPRPSPTSTCDLALSLRMTSRAH